MIQRSLSESISYSGLKFLFLSWTLWSTCIYFITCDIINGQSTPSPSDSWHELQDLTNEPQHLEEPAYYGELGHLFWSWIKDHEVIPDDYEVFNKHLQHYHQIDVNVDGKLDGLELLQYMHHNGMVHRIHTNENEIHNSQYQLTHYEKDSLFIDSLLHDVDTDRDGFLDFYEYQAAATKYDHSKHPVMNQIRKQDHLL